jgi:two-component system sensor histidine kinase FlrB
MEVNEDKTRELNELKEAFESFNSASSELQTSYRELQEQAEGLQSQLAAAQRGRAEEACRNAELARRLTALLEALPGGVIMLDDSGIVRAINSAATDLLGDPLHGIEWQSVCHRSFHDQTYEQGDLTLTDGRRISLAQKDMTPEPGRVLLLTDVTENRKFQELLNRHRRLAAMGEMAAALAHQIRTPLSAALLYTSNASRPELTTEYRSDLLDKATNCLTDLEQLISDMLQFARGASHSESSFSVDELLSAVDRSLRPVLSSDQLLEISSSDLHAEFNGNREALVGAVLNLANNALQSAGKKACVNISVCVVGLSAEIRVTDNGPGIAADQAGKIFDPFYTSRPEGTGLGLAVVKSVARSHGGDVILEDTDVPGATFLLRIPIDIAAVNEQQRAPVAGVKEIFSAGVPA